MAVNTTRFPLRGMQPRSTSMQRARALHAARPSDDEILGLVTAVQRPVAAGSDDDNESSSASSGIVQPSASNGAADDAANGSVNPGAQTQAQNGDAASTISPELGQILDANPQLRDAWNAAKQFRAVFATPAAAQDAKNQLDELDGMFFSPQSGDQAALAARIHDLSPAAFHALAQAMQAHSARIAAAAQGTSPAGNQPADTPADANSDSNDVTPQTGSHNVAAVTPPSAAGANAVPTTRKSASSQPAAVPVQTTQPTPSKLSASQGADPRRAAQLAFFHSTNCAAVHQVITAIESQVNHLLPTGTSAPTKTRIVGEIYRDLSSALGANRQLGQQLREAFRSGSGDAAHQQAIVALVTGRAKQALPSIARRVINEWTHSVVSANQEKLSRQDSAGKRVDISGAGSSDGVRRRPLSPRDMDYKRLSDADILNL